MTDSLVSDELLDFHAKRSVIRFLSLFSIRNDLSTQISQKLLTGDCRTPSCCMEPKKKTNPVAIETKELKIFACRKKRAKKMNISHEAHVIKDIKISWPKDHLPVDFGPIPSSSKRLHSIARRDAPLASMDMDQLDTESKTKIEVNHISGSTFIAKQLKIGGKYSGISCMSCISGSSISAM